MKDKKKYLSLVSHALPDNFSAKKQYLNDISNSVEAYCAEHPDADVEELCRKFGTAEEIAESIATETGGADLLAHQKKKKTNRVAVAVTIAIIILLSVGSILGFYEYTLINSGNYSEEIVINQMTDFDLANEPVEVDGTLFVGDVLVTKVQAVNATKKIEYRNKKQDLLFRVSITSDFLKPYSLTTESLKKICEQRPKIQIETLNKEYSVQTKDVMKEVNSVRLTLLIQKGSQIQEKEITFYADQKGDLH